MPDKDYIEWASKAWKKLTADFLCGKGKFIPFNESDIQAHMYYCMIGAKPDKYENNRLLTTEWKFEDKKIDMAVLRKKDKNPRLLIELKETNSENNVQFKKRISDDINKLEKISKSFPAKPPVKIIGFFFRNNKFDKGIPSSFDKEFKQEAKKIKSEKGIILLYGPK